MCWCRCGRCGARRLQVFIDHLVLDGRWERATLTHCQAATNNKLSLSQTTSDFSNVNFSQLFICVRKLMSGTSDCRKILCNSSFIFAVWQEIKESQASLFMTRNTVQAVALCHQTLSVFTALQSTLSSPSGLSGLSGPGGLGWINSCNLERRKWEIWPQPAHSQPGSGSYLQFQFCWFIIALTTNAPAR